MRDSQQHQQQQQQQPQALKFIQVSNVNKKSLKRKTTNSAAGGNNAKKMSSSSSTTCIDTTTSRGSTTIHDHGALVSTCSTSFSSLGSSTNNNNSTNNKPTGIASQQQQQHDECNASSEWNNASSSSLNQSCMLLPPSSSAGHHHGLHVNMDDQLSSKLSDSSSASFEHLHHQHQQQKQQHHMHGGSGRTNVDSTSPIGGGSSTGTTSLPGTTLQFVMEASPQYSTPHVTKKRNTLSKDNLIKVLHLSQMQACKVLGCSLSTLKRRFGEVKQELGMEKWPSYYDDVRHLPIFPRLYPMSLQYILNEQNSMDLPSDISLLFENAAQNSTTFVRPPPTTSFSLPEQED